MALKQSIVLKQGQRLTMTPQLRQAITILQLNQVDLLHFLEEEIGKNPLLEFESRVSENRRLAGSSTPPGLPPSADMIDQISAEKNLMQHLGAQVSLTTAADEIKKIALCLIAELDENGYLNTPIFEMADRISSSVAQIEVALDLVQACEPAGVGARSLKECLMLQLIENNRFDPVMEKVLENLPLVAKNDTEAISEIIGEGGPETADILAEIRRLNPRPTADFTQSPVREVRPDILVKKAEMGVWRVELVTSALPRVLVNHEYAAEIAAQGDEALVFAHDCERSANWLIKALDQRAQTILQAATAIVQHQHRYFEDGPSAMLPLTLGQIADSLNVHESTISRVTNGKYLICDRGVFELKYFFVTKILSIDRKSEYSSMEIRLRIKDLIDEENHKKPLSDDRIVNLLRDDGVDIARRTIAKYREAMSIPSSVIRRKIKSNN